VRVLLITDWMRSPGGSERYVASVRSGLRSAGHEVRLLTSTAGSAADGTADYRAYGSERRAAQAFLQILNPFAVATVGRAVRELRPDVAFVVLFMYHLSGGVLGRLRGVPTVLSLVDYKCICPLGSKLLPSGRRCTERAGTPCLRHGCVSAAHWVREVPRYAVARAGMRQVRRVLACSGWMHRELAANGIASEVLPLPVTPPGPAFRRCPAPEPIFVYCGRLEAEKGVALLLAALARVRTRVAGARLRIVGDGSERGRLEALARTLGIADAVTFRGWVPAEEVEGELADAWALVAPSLWAEPFGLVAPEAITRGVPVVASADGGLGETVRHGVTGLLFPNGDETALADRLEAIASGRAFPAHALPAALVAQAGETYALGRHIEALTGIFTDLARRVPRDSR
jgi:glycosyltransferase involved in cell wall biosynthesis